MAMFPLKALVFLHLFVIICSCVHVQIVTADDPLPYFPSVEAPKPVPGSRHHHPPPTQPPTKQPPSKPPTKQPPAQPPVKQPLTRKYVAVQGVVYCKSCLYKGIDTLMGATPLAGATVKLQCNNTKNSLVEQAKTDKKGYFFLMPKTLTTAGSHKCKVSLVSSPIASCSVLTNLHGGADGATLTPNRKPPVGAALPLPFQLFTVGPFAFEPNKNVTCHY